MALFTNERKKKEISARVCEKWYRVLKLFGSVLDGWKWNRNDNMNDYICIVDLKKQRESRISFQDSVKFNMSVSHLHVILSFRFFILVSFRLLVITGRNWSFRLSFQHPRKAIFGVKRITMVLFAQTNTRSQWWRISRQNTFHLVGREESGGENERMKMRRWNFTRRGVAPQLIGLRKEWRRFVGEYHGL